MALKRIQDLPDAGVLDGTELVELEKSGLSVKTTTQEIADLSTSGPGGGDVSGPASSVDGNIAVFDGTTGKIIKDGGAPISSFLYDSVSSVSISGGTATINCTSGTSKNFTLTMNSNATLAVTGLSGAGRITEFEIQISQDSTGNRTLAIPSSFKALGGSDTSISLAANSVTVLSAKTFDNGISWRYAMQESA